VVKFPQAVRKILCYQRFSIWSHTDAQTDRKRYASKSSWSPAEA